MLTQCIYVCCAKIIQIRVLLGTFVLVEWTVEGAILCCDIRRVVCTVSRVEVMFVDILACSCARSGVPCPVVMSG